MLAPIKQAVEFLLPVLFNDIRDFKDFKVFIPMSRKMFIFAKN